MPEITDHIVDFEKCKDCQHYQEPEDADICHYCLDQPSMPNSHTPMNFKQKEVNKNERSK